MITPPTLPVVSFLHDVFAGVQVGDNDSAVSGRSHSLNNGAILQADVELSASQALASHLGQSPDGEVGLLVVDELKGNRMVILNGEANAAGEVVGDYTTNTSGRIVIASLAAGTYNITETKAPNGYVLDSTSKSFEVKDDKATLITRWCARSRWWQQPHL